MIVRVGGLSDGNLHGLETCLHVVGERGEEASFTG